MVVRLVTQIAYVYALRPGIRAGILIAKFTTSFASIRNSFSTRRRAVKTDDASQNSAVISKRGRLADFLFVGVAVIPVLLMLDRRPDMGLLLFVPLLLAACLAGMWEQVEAFPKDAEDSDAGPSGARHGPEITFPRRHDARPDDAPLRALGKAR